MLEFGWGDKFTIPFAFEFGFALSLLSYLNDTSIQSMLNAACSDRLQKTLLLNDASSDSVSCKREIMGIESRDLGNGRVRP